MKQVTFTLDAELFLAVLQGHKPGWMATVSDAVQKLDLRHVEAVTEGCAYPGPLYERDCESPHLRVTVDAPDEWDINFISFTSPPLP